MQSGLTSDYQGDGLGLQAHISGDPTKTRPNMAAPSGAMALSTILVPLGVLALLWFLFKSVRI